MKRTLVTIAALALVYCSLGTGAWGAPTGKPATIAVTGTGTVQMTPDQASVNANIMTNDENSGTAISQNNAIYNRVVAALTKIGVSRSDIVLSNYYVNYNARPQGVTPPSYERFGYTVNRSFSMTVRTISEVGAVVDAASSAGVSSINGIAFGLSNADAARAQALTLAVANARREASAIAAAAHLHIVGIKSLGLGFAQQYPRPMVEMMVKSPPPVPTEFDASNVSETVNVSAVYLASP